MKYTVPPKHKGRVVRRQATPAWACLLTAMFGAIVATVLLALACGYLGSVIAPFLSPRVELWVLWTCVVGFPTVVVLLGRKIYMTMRWEEVVWDGKTCSRCGYNLKGNVSGTCPECGEAI